MAAQWPNHHGLQILVNRSDGTPYPLVEHAGKLIIVGEPGDAFTVAVKRTAGYGHHHDEVMLADLSIDRKPVGYRKIMLDGGSDVFAGWLVQGYYDNNTHLKYSTFIFGSCDSSGASEEVQHLDQIAAGKMLVTWHNAVAAGQRQPSYISGPSDDQQQKKLPEGKKWFLAPGLQTDRGEVKAGSSGFNTIIYKEVGPAVAKMEICYDTAENLLLRKVLDVSKPEHKAVLQASASEAVRALLAGGTHGAAVETASRKRKRATAAAAGVGSSSAGTSSRKVKPELGAGPVAHVDLTGKPVLPAVKVGGQELARDEVAVCDLSGGTPSWKVAKKKVERVN